MSASWSGARGHISEDDPGASDDGDESRTDEEDGLRSSLNALARLSSRRLDLEELLTGVAVLAVRAIPGADGAGLTLIELGRSNTIVATADFVTAVDDIQYGIGEGPCISAARDNRTVTSIVASPHTRDQVRAASSRRTNTMSSRSARHETRTVRPVERSSWPLNIPADTAPRRVRHHAAVWIWVTPVGS